MDNKYQQLDGVANWYSSKEGFYGKLVRYGFDSLRPYFVGKTCLELGPADGQMTEMLLNVFERVTSVEGSETFCEKLRSSLGHYNGLSVEHALFEHYDTELTFDSIVMTHILEHLHSPVQVLKKVRSWLAKEGHFLVLVPNASSFHRLVAVKMGLLKAADQLNNLDIRLAHQRVYTRDLLLSHLALGGWLVKETGGVFFKALANSQIDEWFSEEMIEGFYELGKDFPQYAAEIYAVCVPKEEDLRHVEK